MIIPDHLRQIINPYLNSEGNSNEETVTCEKISGGCINTCYRITVKNNRSLFVKYNKADALPGMLMAEKTGLAFLQKQNIINIPQVLDFQQDHERQVLILEWINESKPNRDSWKKLGEQLAGLHRLTHIQSGFEENNYIGSLPQSNKWTDNWIDFFAIQRIKPQIEMAINKSLLSNSHVQLWEKLLLKLPGLFDEEKNSLLHGDLWRGNLLFNKTADPVLIDPAVYFGNRHMDMAMTTLFGGFDPLFYEAYDYHFPLPQDHKQLWDICNLYPLLVHINIFGSAYIQPFTTIIKKYS